MSIIDQYWFGVTADVDAEHDERRLTQARVASASTWSFLAQATTPQEFDDRLALAEERLHKSVTAVVGDDPAAHAEVYPRLVESFQSDFDTLIESRRKDALAQSRRGRLRRTKDPVTRARRAQAQRRKAVEGDVHDTTICVACNTPASAVEVDMGHIVWMHDDRGKDFHHQVKPTGPYASRRTASITYEGTEFGTGTGSGTCVRCGTHFENEVEAYVELNPDDWDQQKLLCRPCGSDIEGTTASKEGRRNPFGRGRRRTASEDWTDDSVDYPDFDSDAFINDDYSVSVEGRPVGQADSYEDAVFKLKVWMDDHAYWPNAWFVNERGNVEQIDPQTGNYLNNGYVTASRKQADKWTGDGWKQHLDEKIKEINDILVNQYGEGPFSDWALGGVALDYEDEYGGGWPEDEGFGSSDRWHVIHGCFPEDFARVVMDNLGRVKEHERLMAEHEGSRKQADASGRDSNLDQLIAQIGKMNLMAVTGFRPPTQIDQSTWAFPCGNGYWVDVQLDASDTYTVKRVFRRAGNDSVKGSVSGIYGDMLGEVFYRAGMFRDDWPQGGITGARRQATDLVEEDGLRLVAIPAGEVEVGDDIFLRNPYGRMDGRWVTGVQQNPDGTVFFTYGRDGSEGRSPDWPVDKVVYVHASTRSASRQRQAIDLVDPGWYEKVDIGPEYGECTYCGEVQINLTTGECENCGQEYEVGPYQPDWDDPSDADLDYLVSTKQEGRRNPFGSSRRRASQDMAPCPDCGLGDKTDRDCETCEGLGMVPLPSPEEDSRLSFLLGEETQRKQAMDMGDPLPSELKRGDVFDSRHGTVKVVCPYGQCSHGHEDRPDSIHVESLAHRTHFFVPLIEGRPISETGNKFVGSSIPRSGSFRQAATEGYERVKAYELQPGDVVRMPGPKDVEVLEARGVGHDVALKFDTQNSQGRYFAPTVHHTVTYERKVTGSRKQAMPNPVDLGVSVGDFFYSSWGYDQTNVDFYEVVGLTAASVRLQQVARRVEAGGVVPIPGSVAPFGPDGSGQLVDHPPPFTARIKSGYRGTPTVSSPTYITGDYAYLWDGSPKYDTTALGYPGH